MEDVAGGVVVAKLLERLEDRSWYEESLLQRQLPAGLANDVGGRRRLHELQPVAEGVSLADHRMRVDLSVGHGELDADQFAGGKFIDQHDRKAGLADVDGVPARWRALAGKNQYFDLQRKSWVVTRILQRGRVGPELAAQFQSDAPSCRASLSGKISRNKLPKGGCYSCNRQNR